MKKRRRGVTKKTDKKLELIAGILAGVGSVFLALGAFNNWLVIFAYIMFLVSAFIYIWWARKHRIAGLLFMNLAYLVSDIGGISTWLYNILK